MGQLFGTDGVRGIANRDLTAELALRIATAAAHVVAGPRTPAGSDSGRPRPTALVARDPRVSGQFLEASVVAGLASSGVDVYRAGVVPTPAAAHLTGALDVDIGVMISASHNPMPDNGIKFLGRGGIKLADELEDEIERCLDLAEGYYPIGAGVGRVRESRDFASTYINHLIGSVPVRLEQLRVVLDCANGAASDIAPHVFESLGADVIAINDAPDGININDACGSTNLGSLQEAVVAYSADAGFAFDGDADRCLAVDARGEVVDGDHILAILAIGAHAESRLAHDTVVATAMSNLGLLHALEAAGIGLVRTDVGDRYVVQAMHDDGYTLGGEQSGHIVMRDYATTGDGILTALHVACRMASEGRSLAELAGVMSTFPQVLINVPNVDKTRAGTDAGLRDAVATAQSRLGERGRVLLRSSGTEPMVRVMVEAPTEDEAGSVAEELVGVVSANLAL